MPSTRGECACVDSSEAADRLASISLGDDESNVGANLIKMSQALAIEGDEMVFCSNCGKMGDDLKGCNGCRCIRYCSAACQKKHWKAHKTECKRIKAVLDGGERQPPVGQYALDMSAPPSEEAITSGLFNDPPPTPDYPICMVRLPSSSGLITYAPCCGKKICTACSYQNWKAFDNENRKRADKNQAVLDLTSCPFCRTPCAEDDIELIRRMEKRSEKDDPTAIFMLSTGYRSGFHGALQDEAKALDLTKRAAELGDNDALFVLGSAYEMGQLGLEFNENAARKYCELAAMGGHARSRYTLGRSCCQTTFNRVTRDSVMHSRIAAAAGYTDAMEYLLNCFEEGYIRHRDFAPSLRARDKVLLEMKSESRDLFLDFVVASGKAENIYKPIYNVPH